MVIIIMMMMITTTTATISQILDLAVLVDHRMKIKENEKRNKYLDLARELKKNMEHEGDGDTSCN